MIFTQGTLGDTVVRTIGGISKKIIDPLTSSEYIYSVNSTQNKFQIKADFENKQTSFEDMLGIYDSSYAIDPAEAATTGYSYIKGNYSSIFEKISTGGVTYIVALPGLIADSTGTTLDYSSLSDKMVVNGSSTSEKTVFTPTIIYSGGSLPTTTTQVSAMMTNLQNAYKTSNITTIPDIQKVVAASGATLDSLGETLVKSTLNVTISNINGTCGTDNGKTLTSTPNTTSPTTNLCTIGTPSAVTGSGPWNWTCTGLTGGSNASCSASDIGDPYWNNVVLLIHGDGENGSTGFIDSKGKNSLITVGNPKISINQSKFGGSSIYFNGVNDYITTGLSTDNFSMGTGDFTIEFWAYITGTGTSMGLVGLTGTSGGSTYTSTLGLIAYWPNIDIQIYKNGDGGHILNEYSLNTWTHFAFVKNTGNLKLYLNGVQKYSIADLTNYNQSYALLGRTTSGTFLSGYIDELRITKGVARYTSNFTPSAQAFPNK